MATQSYHNCPICKEDIQPGQQKTIIAHDLTGWPDVPPISIYAHRACTQARGYNAVAILTSVTDPGCLINPSAQLSLALS